MAARRFDSLARNLGRSGWTRRGLARLVTGLAVTPRLGGSVADVIARKGKKPKPKKCKNGAIKCGGKCVNSRTNALHCGRCGRRCGENRACVDGASQGGECSGNQIPCGALCVDPDDKEEHCGECNNPCNGDLICIDGACGCADPADTRCGNQCVDTDRDPDHCGSCGEDCNNEETCVGGQCNPSGCAANEIDCGDGLCIPDRADACCVRADCGPSRGGNDLSCNLTTHRCECWQSRDWGICTPRASDGGGLCAPCCPGGAGVCQRELVCLSPTMSGCGCPPQRPDACGGFFTAGLCSLDFDTDPHRCGRNCEDCTRGGTAFACCVDGQCVGLAGRGPNVSSSSCFRTHCGTCGSIRGEDAPMCCNNGAGATGQCKVPISGGFCPLP